MNFDGRGLRLFLLGATGFAGFGILAFYGLARSRPEHGAIIMATQPLIGALVVWATRGARPKALTLGSIAVALAGVLLVITRGHLTGIFAGGTGIGDLIMFLGAICWVIYTLGAASFDGWSPLRYTALSCALGVPAIFAATALATLAGVSHPPAVEALSGIAWQMAYIIAFASVLGVLAWNIGNKVLGSTNAMLFINFVPITAFAIEIAQGHHLENVELAGAAMVIGALVANTLMLRTTGKAVATPPPPPLVMHRLSSERLCKSPGWL